MYIQAVGFPCDLGGTFLGFPLFSLMKVEESSMVTATGQPGSAVLQNCPASLGAVEERQQQDQHNS